MPKHLLVFAKLGVDTDPFFPTTLHTFHPMHMYILSEAQFDEIVKALDAARFVVDTCPEDPRGGRLAFHPGSRVRWIAG